MTPDLRAELEAMGVDLRARLDRIEGKLDRLLPAETEPNPWRCAQCAAVFAGTGSEIIGKCTACGGTRWGRR